MVHKSTVFFIICAFLPHVGDVRPAPRTAPRQVLAVGEARSVELEFSPNAAKVYEGLLRVRADHYNARGEIPEGNFVKNYSLRVSGMGKMPHLVVLGEDHAVEEAPAASTGGWLVLDRGGRGLAFVVSPK